MEFSPMKIADVKLIKNFYSSDIRGSFEKIYHANDYVSNGLPFSIKELYYSYSSKNVIRGMHFQSPPHDHHKIVHVIHGSVMDVCVDLRKSSPTYGKVQSVILSDREPVSLYIPKGFAHGFRALEDNTCMLYAVSSVYARESDNGILWDSIDFNWGVEKPIVSERDQMFVPFKDFISPFE